MGDNSKESCTISKCSQKVRKTCKDEGETSIKSLSAATVKQPDWRKNRK